MKWKERIRKLKYYYDDSDFSDEDIYADGAADSKLNDGELSAEEAAFINGYNDF